MEGSIESVFWCFKDPHAGLELSAAKSGREGGQRDSATMSMERKRNANSTAKINRNF